MAENRRSQGKVYVDMHGITVISNVMNRYLILLVKKTFLRSIIQKVFSLCAGSGPAIGERISTQKKTLGK